MIHSILTLRFTRRAIGVAVIRGGEMFLLDGRFLNPRPERTLPAALRYLEMVIEQTKPTAIAIDAPGSDGSTLAERIREVVERLARDRRIPLLVLERSDILSSFGVTRIADRRTLRELIQILWPGIEDVTRKVKPYVADAAAAALYAECHVELPQSTA